MWEPERGSRTLVIETTHALTDAKRRAEPGQA